MSWASLIPAGISILGSLFGGGKGKAIQQLPAILQTSQGKDLVNYMMSMYKQPSAGNYMTNMGAYNLMNTFYPNAGYTMPGTSTTTTGGINPLMPTNRTGGAGGGLRTVVPNTWK